MKQFLLFSIVVLMVALAACKKSSPTPDNSSGSFKFTSLVAKDTLIKVNDITTLTAVATGEGLTYTWTCDFGTFIPTGSSNAVQWTVCHSDVFTITCTIKDNNNNSANKNVIIRTHD